MESAAVCLSDSHVCTIKFSKKHRLNDMSRMLTGVARVDCCSSTKLMQQRTCLCHASEAEVESRHRSCDRGFLSRPALTKSLHASRLHGEIYHISSGRSHKVKPARPSGLCSVRLINQLQKEDQPGSLAQHCSRQARWDALSLYEQYLAPGSCKPLALPQHCKVGTHSNSTH